MDKKDLKWNILNSSKLRDISDIISILLKNRGLKTKKQTEEFLNPKDPVDITLKELKLDEKSISKAIKRIEKAIKKGEHIVIYGDYDADGVCATAILWETLFKLTKNVSPYIPNRFKEGYGINTKSVQELKTNNEKLSLIITVDNGIVADDAVETANKLGIDVIVTDHHEKADTLPKAYSIVHTTITSGSGVSWFLSREINKSLLTEKRLPHAGLELAAIGTIADQLPLIGVNRSIARFGIEELNNTKRPGLLAIFKEAKISSSPNFNSTAQQLRPIGTYEINYVIAPRLNAMGRMANAIDSLRLLCTTKVEKAEELAKLVGKTNLERQIVVDKVVFKVLHETQGKQIDGSIVISGEYHEGVIGLAAGKLAEEFYRPAIVISEGKEISKASARSIAGFNIIEVIRKLNHIIEGGGGHQMAAGFSIRTERISEFVEAFNKEAIPLLTDEVLGRKLNIDLELDFDKLTESLAHTIKMFEPVGNGNYSPVFVSKNVLVIGLKSVGTEGKHIKLKLRQSDKTFDCIYFNAPLDYQQLKPNQKIHIAYYLEENIWNGNKTLQLRIKDLKLKPYDN